MEPLHPDANHNLGVLAFNIGKAREALPFFISAVEANPRIKQYWMSYIAALIKLNKIDDAKTIFDKAKLNGIHFGNFLKLRQQLTVLKPTAMVISNAANPSEDHLRSLVDLYNKGEFNKLFDEISLLLKKFPNSERLYNIKGSSHLSLGQYKAAVESYNKALSIKPDYVEVLNNMGGALHESGKLEEALYTFRRALSINQNYADAYYNMGRSLYVKQDLYEAVKFTKKHCPLNLSTHEPITIWA